MASVLQPQCNICVNGTIQIHCIAITIPAQCGTAQCLFELAQVLCLSVYRSKSNNKLNSSNAKYKPHFYTDSFHIKLEKNYELISL